MMKSLASSAAGHMFSSEELFAIKKLIDSQATMAAPSHYIQPRMVFRTKEVTTEQEKKLASLRHDTKCQASLENTLSWVNDKIEEFPEVSESALICHLHSVLPLHTEKSGTTQDTTLQPGPDLPIFAATSWEPQEPIPFVHGAEPSN